MDTRDILEQTQTELEDVSERAEESSGIDRRDFLFISLVAAAANALGAPAALKAQGRGAAGAAAAVPQAPLPIIPLGEPISWSFQVYPGGTGAILEKLRKERGAQAFDRNPHSVEKWSGAVPSNDDDIAFLPAHRLSALLKARKITSARLTDIYLTRLKRFNPTLLCAVTILESQAREEAARADAEIAAGKYRGPLHGIPYGVKDLFSVKGYPTAWGDERFEHQVIDEDAEIVVRLREAGAVLLAKLATGRFANNDVWFRGRTNNPWDVRRGSSGSSAGPSSATAAGCVAFAIGTETSGSIVSPSRECGLSALRPTFGRVSRHGGMVLGYSRDRVGPICRTIEDCAMVFNTLHGVDEKDPSTISAPFHFDRNIKLSSLRIGVDANAPKEFVDKLVELGAKPIPIGPRPQPAPGVGGGGESTAFFDYFVQLKARELGIDVATIEQKIAAATPRGGGRGGRGGAAADTAGRAVPTPAPPELQMLVGLPGITGQPGATAVEFIQSQRRRHMHMVEMQKFLEPYDLYLPNAGGWDVGLHSTTGHPCAVVQYKFEPRVGDAVGGGPAGRGGAGRAGGAGGDTLRPPPTIYNAMPTCAVIAGNLFNDDVILSVAHQFQTHTDFHTHRPTSTS
ncbi:MAG TPA: amidase [Gemmatimonadaceae bacterium]|nr:amidase [Gemmatimonadaceae bacterium]